uniref:Ig-like domain-containing protein n=1 Tax=Periophthalmus magnuspinnatus TaxID=409849 RepID=A0A3B3ZHX7_9GOBI
MEKKLQLCVLMLQLQGELSLAVWQHISVMKGHTLNLNCPLKSQFPDHAVEWRNTDGNIMFFNMIKGVKDKRYRLHKLSESEFRISISKVTFSDGGIYTCSHYLPQAESKRVNVTVIGKPRIERTTHEGWTVIRCTAEANYSPPNLSWKFKNGLEFLHDETQIHMVPLEKKYVSIQTIYVKPAEKTFAVKCIMRHPAWHSWIPLMDFVNIRPNRVDYDVEKREGKDSNTSLLVFLITCLMVGLLVVVIFIGIKLRKAHIIWKRDESVVEQYLCLTGLFNTGLTQYVIQEPTVITSVTNPAAMTPPETTTSEHNSAAPVPPPAPPLKSPVKETEL